MLNSINTSSAEMQNMQNNSSLSQNAPTQTVQTLASKIQNSKTKANSSSTQLLPENTQTSLDKAIEKLNKAMTQEKLECHFEVNEELNRPIVKIVNIETQEVVKQIPTEEAIRISQNIDKIIGMLMDGKI